MNEEDGKSIEELEETAEHGEMTETEGRADDSIGGTMSVQSLRLPDDMVRAFELVARKKRLGRTSVMRMALAEWLNENHPEELEETSRQDVVSPQ